MIPSARRRLRTDNRINRPREVTGPPPRHAPPRSLAPSGVRSGQCIHEHHVRAGTSTIPRRRVTPDVPVPGRTCATRKTTVCRQSARPVDSSSSLDPKQTESGHDDRHTLVGDDRRWPRDRGRASNSVSPDRLTGQLVAGAATAWNTLPPLLPRSQCPG